jgi:hypothetical protein
MFRKGALVALAASVLVPSVVMGAEKTLEFQLVTKVMDPRKIDVPNMEGQSITQGTAFGVAVFNDGKIAIKDFVFVADRSKDSMSQSGYSTYTFEDGSTLTLSWTAAAKPGQPYHGEYKVLSGTGVYAGATGSGTFDPVDSKLKGVMHLKVKLVVKTP